MFPLPKFILYSAQSTVLWTATLATAGYQLGKNYRAVANFVEPISNIVAFVGIASYLYRVAAFAVRSDLSAATIFAR